MVTGSECAPPLQQLSCGLAEGRGPEGQPVPQCPQCSGKPEPQRWSPESDPSFPDAVQALLAPMTPLWASGDPPHTPGHFPLSSLSLEMRLLAMTLLYPSFSSMADPSPNSDTHSLHFSPGSDPSDWVPGEAAPGYIELVRQVRWRLVSRCVLERGAARNQSQRMRSDTGSTFVEGQKPSEGSIYLGPSAQGLGLCGDRAGEYTCMRPGAGPRALASEPSHSPHPILPL